MIIDFEQYLQFEFSDENPEILDDNQPDAFNDWIAELEPDDWFRLGNKFARKIMRDNLPKGEESL
jgi:hypothetical protein